MELGKFFNGEDEIIDVLKIGRPHVQQAEKTNGLQVEDHRRVQIRGQCKWILPFVIVSSRKEEREQIESSAAVKLLQWNRFNKSV